MEAIRNRETATRDQHRAAAIDAVTGADRDIREKMQMKRARIPIIIAAVLLLSSLIYISDVYPASEEVQGYLSGSEDVKVVHIKEGLFLDGKGSRGALVFYPGGKVEYTAYLPLLHSIAASGTDCFLVKMPVNLAILGKDRADGIIRRYDYRNWYIGGHSLGGVAAAMYAADHELDGLIMLAAYPTDPEDEPALELYGSEDAILNMEKRKAGDQYLPQGSVIEEINGGNHAQFGNYGVQKGDGEAKITREEQQRQTAERITAFVRGTAE